jgi:cation diffusion facilitator CzcD-associated flavoprotein CzcO
VIGTGASAIQLVPQVAKVADVTVFQRTPPWVVPKLDREIPAWEQALYARVPAAQRAVRAGVFAVTDGVGVAITRAPALMRIGEVWSRRHMRQAIADPELRAKVTPDYRLGCKRILPSGDWYQALARPNVDLVTDGIERIVPGGVVARDGTTHELDALVCSTGFRIEEVFSRMNIRGRGGRTLTDTWAEGIEAHRGTTVSGFPNLAILSGPNTGTGSTSQVFMIEAQIHYVMELLRTARRTGSASFDVRPESQARYNRWLQRRMQQTVWLRGGCDSWYLDERGVNTTLYPGPSSEFWRSLRRVRADEYDFAPVPRTPAPASTPDPVLA